MADSSWEFADPSEAGEVKPANRTSENRVRYEVVLKEDHDGFQALESIIDQLEV